MRVRFLLVAGAVLALTACGGSHQSAPSGATASRAGGDWGRFGYDAVRSNSGPSRTGITAASVGKLRRLQIRLPGTADSSPIYLRGVRVHGRSHDVFFVTTSYGITLAVDARTGTILWRFKPRGYASWAGSDRITNSSPVADPNRRYLYAEAPNGRVYKLAVASGAVVWSVSVTKLPTREKLGTPLNFSRGLVIATTGGYFGDAPPYQGHVATITRRGRIVHVWNSLCSDRHRLIVPSSCPQSDSAIWARSGAVVVPRSGNLLVATGNAPFDGSRYWGDSVLMLTPNASQLLHSWTPRNQAQLNGGDVDLGSTAPAVLGPSLAAQSGKDGIIRLLRLPVLGGRLGHLGGELQTIQAPGGSGVFSTMAVSHAGGTTRMFVGNGAGVWGYVLSGGRLQVAWRRAEAGTSPVLAGGLLYVYDPNGGLNVFNPSTGGAVGHLPAGGGHWESPIVTDGRIALAEGDANSHSTSGVLDIWR
ncbi:MAG TPA: PQQ-binding-like beta-propeller repeat protein [Gaiellaceae bacterium]|nr:PQQ-binding-like beta-propeller repeat protein [Gaiellaceae bacterium]